MTGHTTTTPVVAGAGGIAFSEPHVQSSGHVLARAAAAELTFEKAGTVTVPFAVRSIAAQDGGHDMHGMDHGDSTMGDGSE